MDEILRTVLGEIRSAWRFRWSAVLTAWCVCVLGWAGVALWPDEYEAQATVFVDISSRLDQVIGDVAIEWNLEQQVERVRQEMLSRPVLESVARETDLDLRVRNPVEMSELLASLQERIVIQDNTPRQRDPRAETDRIFTIRFRDRDRGTALAVVETLLTIFVRDVVRGGRTDSEQAEEFLTKRISDYEKMLQEREQALANFKKENMGLLPGDEGDYFERLQEAVTEVRTLEADLRTAEQRRDALRAQLGSENPMLPQASSPAVGQAGAVVPGSSLSAQIADLESELNEMLLRFTDQHPDVIAARERLELLKERREEELAMFIAAGGAEFEGAAISTSPVYQNIQIALNEINVEIAAIESRISQHAERVTQLRAKVDVMPQIEAELAGLVRDYDQVKEMHDELVSRLEQERLGTAAVASNGNFSIIQPPLAGFEPDTPNRPLSLAAVLLFGMAGGGGMAYLLSLLNPVFTSSRSLRLFTGLPVLGSVTAAPSPAEKLRARSGLLSFGASVVLLVVVFGLAVIFAEQTAGFAQTILRTST